MWTRNSSRNIWIAETIGIAADGPKKQIVVIGYGKPRPGAMLSHTSKRRSRSLIRPSPDSMRCMIFDSHPVPSRQGVHWPQDSRSKKRTRRQAARTMQVVSSMTTIDPEPSIEPPPPGITPSAPPTSF